MTELNTYNHLAVEKKWQTFWETNKTFSVDNKKSEKTFYALDMFPFPSGAGLHVGHPEGYTATDIICRKKRMQGYKVLHPMGWDAFGLPAENFAIKTGVHPKKSTNKNIQNFTRQIKSLGFSYDWDREFSTTDEDYYTFTQDLFLKLYDKNLLYEDDKPLNWCASCKVVCANEEVEQELHERCGNVVTKKALKQWMFKITDYAERLLQDLDAPNVIVLHGLGGNGDSGWGADIRKFFIQNNIKCNSPTFPNSNNPQYSEWKIFFEKNVLDSITPQTIIFGHSLGGGFLQKYLSEENLNVKFSELILVAPTIGDCGISEISNFFTKKFNYHKISKSVENIFIYAGGKDPYITTKEFNFLTEKLSAQLIFNDNQEHFWGDWNLEKIPEILEKCNKILASTIDWPNKIKAMQRNWIGKSTGAEIDFMLENSDTKITVYTTRPDTLFGATYFVLSPEHPLVKDITTNEKQGEISTYQLECSRKSELERTELNKNKTGVFTGSYVINPVNNKKIPVWIADYVMMGYGTGAIMSVPAHDDRDKEFAEKYNLPITEVVVDDKLQNSGFLNELSVKEAKEKMIIFLEEKKLGKKTVNYKLRDWIFTRQRYWGEPIPLVFTENGKCLALDNSQLPLILPESANYEPSESGESPLAKITEWVNVSGYITDENKVIICAESEIPKNKIFQKFTRETSTMPNWAGSSWYWLRYMDPKNSDEAWSKDAEQQWGPVDLYVGGAEHAVLHLLYARFWHKAFYDLGLVSTKEPFKKLVNQGLILSYAYQRKTGGLIPTDEVEEKNSEFFEISTGEKLEKIVAKMSKSLKNVVNPDDIVEAYGADTLRMYEMFMGPFKQNKAWDTTALEGMNKFLMKIWRLFSEKEISESCPSKELIKLTHQTVKKVSDDIDNFKFNTAISQMMIWVNAFQKLDTIPKISGGKFVRLLSPFAPHLAEELWQKFSPEDKTISFKSWPSYKEELLVEDEVTYAVQVNGKLRGDFSISKTATKEECIAAAKKLEKVAKFIFEAEENGGQIRKEIFVPGKIVGFVVK